MACARGLIHLRACLTVGDSVTLPQSFSAFIIQDGGGSKLDEVPGYDYNPLLE